LKRPTLSGILGWPDLARFEGLLKERSSLPRIAVRLPLSLDRKIRAYCLAAGAAGVTVLALADPLAEAKVIYTPAYGHLPLNRWMPVDLNHDGITDLTLTLSSSVYKVVDRAVAAQPATGGGIIGYLGQFNGYASALIPGRPIGSKGPFLPADGFLCRTEISHYVNSFTFSAGAWREVKDRYLGVKFTIDGATHYGWIRMSVNRSHKIEAIVTGYAYESVADQAIRAGQTSDRASEAEDSTVGPETVSSADPALNIRPGSLPLSLGILALGAIGRQP
jgi:hypothetical protein